MDYSVLNICIHGIRQEKFIEAMWLFSRVNIHEQKVNLQKSKIIINNKEYRVAWKLDTSSTCTFCFHTVHLSFKTHRQTLNDSFITVNHILYACDNFLQGSQGHRRRYYFSPRTYRCHMVVITRRVLIKGLLSWV